MQARYTQTGHIPIPPRNQPKRRHASGGDAPRSAAASTPRAATGESERDEADISVEPDQLEHTSASGVAKGPVGGRAIVGGTWTTGAQVAPFIFTIVVSVVAGRILGPSGLGRQSFIAFVVLTVTTVFTGGLSAALIRNSAEALGRNSPGSVNGLARWGWRVGTAAALLAALLLVTIALLGATPQAAWIFGALAAATGILNRVPSAILTGTQHWRDASLVLVLGTGAGAAASIVAVSLGGGITGIQAATAAASTAILVGSCLRLKPVLARLRGSDASALPQLRRSTSRYALVSSVTVVLTFMVAQRSEIFFLNHQSTNAQIAFYSVAFSATTILATLLVGTTNVFSPTFAQFLGAGQLERIRSGYSRAVRLLILLALPITAAGLVLGPPLIVLAYGERYAEAGNVLRVLVAVVPLAALGGVSTAVLTGYGRMRFPILVSAAAATADIVFAALLVHRLDAVGAAIANDIAVFTAVALQVVYCFRLLGGIELAPRFLMRMAIASALAAAAAQGVLELDDGLLSFGVAVVVGIGVLSVLAIWLRVLPQDDAAWLTNALGDTRAHRVTRVCSRLSGSALPER